MAFSYNTSLRMRRHLYNYSTHGLAMKSLKVNTTKAPFFCRTKTGVIFVLVENRESICFYGERRFGNETSNANF